MNSLPQEFAEAWLNKSHIVLGKTLQPYCLYHVLALQVIDSPAVLGGRMSPEELEKAVLICSIPLPKDQKEAARYSNTVANLFDGKSKSWLKKLSLYFWHKRNRKRYLKELIKFQVYIKDYSTFPKVSSELKGKSNGANHILSRAGFYIYQTGCSVEYVFSMPIGQLNHLSMYFSAMNSGKITFEEELNTNVDIYRNLLELINKGEAVALDSRGQ